MESRSGWKTAAAFAASLLAAACAGSGTLVPEVTTPQPSVALGTPTAVPTDRPAAPSLTHGPSPTTSFAPTLGATYPPIPSAKSYLNCATTPGGEFEDPWAGFAWGDTPEGALEDLLGSEYPQGNYPQSGYERADQSDAIVVLAYAVEDAVKVALVVAHDPPLESAPPRPWVAMSVAKCDFSELGVDVVLQRGIGVWRNVELGLIGIDVAGPRHCDWQSVRFLSLSEGGQSFVRDPEGVLLTDRDSPYVGDTHLPDGAVDTGYRRGHDQLWRESGRKAIYVITPDTVERWPKDPGEVGCA